MLADLRATVEREPVVDKIGTELARQGVLKAARAVASGIHETAQCVVQVALHAARRAVHAQ
ncbi:MAG: hypothetical protein IPP44_26165 [Ideonella sp.]|nr:hypothetical protein [Ideonella sp.]